ncbi:MAG: phosphonate C-P lyase system protein PhnL [Sneathiella sp.]|nr:MAG: phosphonate C-P lyase system protein PhnL [Sneathiella sp.]
MSEMMRVENIAKSFTLHVQQGAVIPVFKNINMTMNAGDCIALTGASGAGKSTFMRMVYANYVCHEGNIFVRHLNDWVDMVHAEPHTILNVRRHTLGYVSQFLRVIPRVSTLDVVMEPMKIFGIAAEEAQVKAEGLLARLNIPPALWSLSPLTFSGGEQQRVNIARGFATEYPIMLLDEPTASLDAENKAIVLDLITEAKDRGTAILGIFHDAAARDAICTSEFDISQYRVASDA